MPVRLKLIPIIPEQNYVRGAWDAWERAITDVLVNRVGPLLANDMEQRVSNWTHRPQAFKQTFRALRTRFVLDVVPYGQGKRFWVWVSGGVAEHYIAPRRPFYGLKIKKGYVSKTAPGGIYGRTAYYKGPFYTTQRGKGVTHPGIEARRFEKDIVSDREVDIALLVMRRSNAVLKAYTPMP